MDSLKQPSEFDDVESFTTTDTINYEDVIESPVIPPKKEFRVKINTAKLLRNMR